MNGTGGNVASINNCSNSAERVARDAVVREYPVITYHILFVQILILYARVEKVSVSSRNISTNLYTFFFSFFLLFFYAADNKCLASKWLQN
jgi:hypothetical protein